MEPLGISRSVSWVGEATEPQLVGSTSNVGGPEVKPFTLPELNPLSVESSHVSQLHALIMLL